MENTIVERVKMVVSGTVLSPEDAEKIKRYIDGHIRPLTRCPEMEKEIPLQCGERLQVRGQTWEVSKIDGKLALMTMIPLPERVPDAIKDLMYANRRNKPTPADVDADVIEAYRRGVWGVKE